MSRPSTVAVRYCVTGGELLASVVCWGAADGVIRDLLCAAGSVEKQIADLHRRISLQEFADDWPPDLAFLERQKLIVGEDSPWNYVVSHRKFLRAFFREPSPV